MEQVKITLWTDGVRNRAERNLILGHDYLRGIGALAICDDVADFSEEYLDAYVVTDGSASLDLDKVKFIKKEMLRKQRAILMQELDVEYFVEAERIFKGGIFRKTKGMDEIFRKKEHLRDVPVLVDGMATVHEVIAFKIDLDAV